MPVPETPDTLGRTLLRDDVFGRLREAIVSGTLAPGEHLRDVELANWLGVSRTPVREALLRLSAAGLVSASPGRSTVVTSLDVRAVREAREVVAAMHQVAVREAVEHLTRRDLSTMREANRRFRAAVRSGDLDSALRADDDLHAVPVAVSANRAVAAVLDQFTPVLRRAERLRFASLGGKTSVVRHDELIRLCADGDAERAADLAFDTWHTLPTGAHDDAWTADPSDPTSQESP